ncbi:MAG: hypothetical protein V1767_05565 [Chloroflexota bacterium]
MANNRKTTGLFLTTIIVFSSLLAGCTSSTSPSLVPSLSKADAIKILIDQVIKPGSLDHAVIAFTLDKPLAQGAKVAPYAPDPLPTGVTTLPHLVEEVMTAPTGSFG